MIAHGNSISRTIMRNAYWRMMSRLRNDRASLLTVPEITRVSWKPTFEAKWLKLTFPTSFPSYGTDWLTRISFAEYEIHRQRNESPWNEESYPRGKISISGFKITEAEADVCQSEEVRTFSAHLDFCLWNGASLFDGCGLNDSTYLLSIGCLPV